MGISVAVLFVLFPVLMGLSSGALVTAALVILALRVVGLAWAWNPVTIVLGALALVHLHRLVVRPAERGGNARPGLSAELWRALHRLAGSVSRQPSAASRHRGAAGAEPLGPRLSVPLLQQRLFP